MATTCCSALLDIAGGRILRLHQSSTMFSRASSRPVYIALKKATFAPNMLYSKKVGSDAVARRACVRPRLLLEGALATT